MKYTIHLETTKFLDVKYSLGFYPLIVKPTRICTKSTTLIDNIFTNDRCNEMNNYILIDYISDHLPVFSISSTFKWPHIENNRVNKRKINENTVNKLKTRLNNIDWNCLHSYTDVNKCNDYFFKVFMQSLNECCPIQSVSLKSTKDKPWLTNGL